MIIKSLVVPIRGKPYDLPVEDEIMLLGVTNANDGRTTKAIKVYSVVEWGYGNDHRMVRIEGSAHYNGKLCNAISTFEIGSTREVLGEIEISTP